MMSPTEQQSRLLCDMLEGIELFRQGELSFYHMVCGLEAALEAGEFRDRDFVRMWYDLWAPLEIKLALVRNEVYDRVRESDAVPPDEVEVHLVAMEKYVTRVLGGAERCCDQRKGPW